MPINLLVKTVVFANAVAGEYRFEIFQDERAKFYANISRKNGYEVWVTVRDEYGFSMALDVEEAIKSCIKFVDNIASDLQAIEAMKRI